MNLHGAGSGSAIMIVSEAATLAQIEPFWSWNTPIAWTGFILFADGDRLARARRLVAPLGAARVRVAGARRRSRCGCVFEGYNLIIRNWHYVGLPENFGAADVRLRLVVRDDLAGAVRRRGADRVVAAGQVGREAAGQVRTGAPDRPASPPALPALPALPAAPVAIAAGALMLASPFLVPRDVARYLAAPVWLGFIFLLDPINARLGGESLWTRSGARAGATG